MKSKFVPLIVLTAMAVVVTTLIVQGCGSGKSATEERTAACEKLLSCSGSATSDNPQSLCAPGGSVYEGLYGGANSASWDYGLPDCVSCINATACAQLTDCNSKCGFSSTSSSAP